MRNLWLFLSLAILGSAAMAAQNSMSISRAVYVARAHDGGVALEPAETLRRGDRVVLVMEWDGDPAQPFTLVSKVPNTLAYQRSGDRNVQVSVDGGRRWGRIGSLRHGDRLAAPEDVTNLRWRIASADDEGMRSYSAIVR